MYRCFANKFSRVALYSLLLLTLGLGGYSKVETAAPTVSTQIVLTPVVTGLADPVFVTNAKDGTNRLFITELSGIIKVVQPGASSATIFLDIRDRVIAAGELGLLGLAFHPQYQTNRRFFVHYTRNTDAITGCARVCL